MPRVFVVTCSMRGHLMPNVRLAQYLATLPGLEVHFITDKKGLSSLPKLPVIVHLPEPDEVPPTGIDGIEKIFADVALHPKTNNTLWTLYVMISAYYATDSEHPVSPARTYFVAMQKFVYALGMKLKPDLIIAETHFDHVNGMQTFCKVNNIKLMKVLCPGRPDPAFDQTVVLKAFMPYVLSLMEVNTEMNKYKPDLAAAGGWTDEDWVADGAPVLTLLPGSRGLVAVPPAPSEFFVGPFIDLPGTVTETVPTHQAAALEFLAKAGDEPVVYIAFGTLVVLHPQLVLDIVDGLNEVRCKVLWALPEEQQSMLPPSLSGIKWCIQKFMPQPAVLRSGKVQCFISHCGGSSTHESLSTATPMVCIPHLGDQIDWATDVCDYLKAGVMVDKTKATSSSVRDAVDKVLTDPEFKKNAMVARDKIAIDSLSPELPPGQMGVQAAGRVVLEFLTGRDLVAERQTDLPAEPEEEESIREEEADTDGEASWLEAWIPSLFGSGGSIVNCCKPRPAPGETPLPTHTQA